MNTTTHKILVIAASVLAAMLLLFDSGAVAEMTISNELMGNGAIGGMHWTLIPALFLFGLGALSVWVIFGQDGN